MVDDRAQVFETQAQTFVSPSSAGYKKHDLFLIKPLFVNLVRMPYFYIVSCLLGLLKRC